MDSQHNHGQHSDADHAHDTHAHDDWHRHSAEEGEPQAEHTGTINTRVIFLWFAGGIVFLVATIMAIIMYFDHYSSRRITVAGELEPAARLYQQYQDQRVTMEKNVDPQGYVLLDPAKGTARTPLEVTMRRVAEQYQAKQGRPQSAVNEAASRAPAK